MNMTKEEAMEIITNALQSDESKYTEKIDKALALAQKAFGQEPCEDCVSRQAVLDIAKSSKSNWIDNSVLFKRVNELPSVNPQQKTGHWIKIKPYPLQMHEYECSECLHETDDNTENYCSECGAKMESEEGRNDNKV